MKDKNWPRMKNWREDPALGILMNAMCKFTKRKGEGMLNMDDMVREDERNKLITEFLEDLFELGDSVNILRDTQELILKWEKRK